MINIGTLRYRGIFCTLCSTKKWIMRRKKIYLRTSALLVLIMLSTGTFAKDYILHSPDHRVSVTIGISDSIGFNVIMDGKSIVKQAKIAFLTDMSADKRLKVRKVSRSSVNTVLHLSLIHI